MNKLAFEKVKLRTHPSENGVTDTYKENKNRLGFLPTIFVFLVAASLVIVVFSYFKSITSQDLKTPQSQLSSDKNFQASQVAINTEKNQETGNTTQNQFSLENTFDTRRIDKFTYYLTGKCQNGEGSCSLWQVDNFSGQSKLLQKDVANTGNNQENQIKPGSVLRFAKNQDIAGGLNFILINDKNTSVKSFKLIRLDLNSLEIIENSEIKLGQKEYPNYFR